MKLLKWLFRSRKPALNKPVVSGSLHNPNFGIDNPIAKGEINTGGLGYKALEIKEPVVIGYYAGTEKNGEHSVIGYYAGTEKNGEHSVIGYYAGNQDANGNDR
jgi:hypothetical protein